MSYKASLFFHPGECLEILNHDQYIGAKHLLRNPNMDYPGPFPIYFAYASSVSRGQSIGIILEPIDTFTNEPLKVISL